MAYPTRLVAVHTATTEETSTEIKIPDGSAGAGVFILFWTAFTVQATTPTWVDITPTLLDLDDTGGLNGGWVAYSYVTTGSEGWTGTNDTTTITHASAGVVAFAISYDNATIEGSVAVGKVSSTVTSQINQTNLNYGSSKPIEWVHFGLNDGDGGAPGYPSGYDSAQDSVMDLGDTVRGSMCIKQATASAEDPGVWSQASPTHWASTLVAIPGVSPPSTADRVVMVPAPRVWTPN